MDEPTGLTPVVFEEPVHVPAEMSTAVVAFDQALVTQLERDVEHYKKIISIAIRLTNPQDWVNQNGKPYLQSSGAEKIASPFLVTMGKPERTRLEREDGKGKSYIWVYEALFSSRRLGRSIVAQGKCSSRDQFFGQNSKWIEEDGKRVKVMEYKPIEDIAEESIMQSAYTNLFVNGVTRLLGIRNLTWEQLAAGGISADALAKVEYAKKNTSAPAPAGDDGWRKMPTKFAGKCAHCEIPHAEKDEIFYNPKVKGVLCPPCYDAHRKASVEAVT